jgi:hypothetical protein
MSGSTEINQLAIHGDKGVPSQSNIPGSRSELVSWVDDEGSFWIFGGHGYDDCKKKYHKSI